jgi:hypothetical protein
VVSAVVAVLGAEDSAEVLAGVVLEEEEPLADGSYPGQTIKIIVIFLLSKSLLPHINSHRNPCKIKILT